MRAPNHVPSTEPGAPATRVRYGVLGFAAALSMVTYLDRVCISSGQSRFIEALGLSSEAELAIVFTAFTIAYSIFEVPSGWLGDVWGPKRVLIRIVLCWSFFTAVTGAIGMRVGGVMLGGLGTLIVVRFLFGMCEAGAYPNITRALHNWIPFGDRGFAQGVVWMSARLMGGLTPMVWLLLVEGVRLPESIAWRATDAGWDIPPLLSDWRMAFWLFGVIGIVWCLLFIWWFRDRPEQKPSVNAAELAMIRQSSHETEAGPARVPWMEILKSRNLWALCLMYACQAYGWYFYITYLPRFLEQQYDVRADSLLGAVYKGGPLWMGAIGCLCGGYLTDWYIRRTGDRKRGRKIFGIFGHALCGVAFLACPYAPTAFWFFLAISLAGFFADLTMGSSWALCQDIGRRHAAIVAGFMNMIGNAGGALANFVGGAILSATLARHANSLGLTVEQMKAAKMTDQINIGLLPGYHINFFVFAAACALGVVCWSLIDATKPVCREDT